MIPNCSLRSSTPHPPLACLQAQGETFGLPVVPIPGTRSAARVAENAASTALVLTGDQRSRLARAADLAHGTRNLDFAGPDWISAGRE
ncbi:hypothetical protein GGG17_10900 [Arsenicicoccus sp. MKL-02]|uniref:Uncharacterized protein n=1 Tax=Arsenicicoccus cauae TaxID=2663847 RepID=A0A6I3IZP3_9MICO|nr:hypothetical protein [Arsenicicoccus cauae]